MSDASYISVKVWNPYNIRRLYYTIQALFIVNDKKNTLTKCVWVVHPRNDCIIQVVMSGKKMGISKRSKWDPLANAIRKEIKNRVLNVIFVIFLRYFHHTICDIFSVFSSHLTGCMLQLSRWVSGTPRQKNSFKYIHPL